MNNLAISVVVVPGVMALLLFLVFTYLYEQSRQQYFRAWQFAWAAYTLHYAVNALEAFRGPAAWSSAVASLLLSTTAICIFISTRLMRKRLRLRWLDAILALGGLVLAVWSTRDSLPVRFLRPRALPWLRTELLLAVLLLYCSFYFYRHAQRKNSFSFKLLSTALALWAALMFVGGFPSPFAEMSAAASQVLLGISMVMVLFENERNAVQENALAFSTLGVDQTRLLSVEELKPSLQGILERLIAPLPTTQAAICITER